MKNINIKPIGFVKNSEKQAHFGRWRNVVSEIAIDKKLAEALDGIEDYSHIIVIYWMDKVKHKVIKHHPQGREDVPLVGILACRCPGRPNPIGISTVKLLGRRGNVLKVKGLDVIDGTPIIDIKPFTPQYDVAQNPRVPNWVNRLEY